MLHILTGCNTEYYSRIGIIKLSSITLTAHQTQLAPAVFGYFPDAEMSISNYK